MLAPSPGAELFINERQSSAHTGSFSSMQPPERSMPAMQAKELPRRSTSTNSLAELACKIQTKPAVRPGAFLLVCGIQGS